jgi:hypothetical protein
MAYWRGHRGCLQEATYFLPIIRRDGQDVSDLASIYLDVVITTGAAADSDDVTARLDGGACSMYVICSTVVSR